MENLLVPDQATIAIPSTRILVFAPHPDDEVLGCGGAIMRHVEQGIPVCVIVVSDGAHGVSEETTTEYTLQRQNESIAAAHILGYGTPVFWQYRDRQVSYSEKLIQEIITVIRETGADLVYAPSVFEMHPDHRALAMAVIEAVRRIGQPVRVALYEVGVPLHPNQLLDISDLVARKTAAMECFSSQNARQRYDLHIAALNRYRTYTLPASVTAAEAYILLSAEELSNDPLKLYQPEHTRQKALGLALDSRDLPLVSVIIRSMDRPTLSDALDSVALQTYPNIEVVIVNAKGANHRETGEWCGRFPLRMVGNNEPLNRSRAANAGLEAARGDYLIFLDDDDWFMPHHIAKLQAALDQSDSVIAAYSAIRCVNESGEEISRYEEDFDPIQLRIENFIPIHAVLFRRSAFDNGARFDETLAVCEDWDFWLQLLEQGAFKFIPEVGAIYSIQQGKGSGVRENKMLTRQVMTAIYRKWIPRWSDETLWTVLEYARCKKIAYSKEQTIIQLDQAVADRNHQISELLNSTSWRIT
ncbi:MAG: PIG-L family deacetylase, partial [Pseudomonadota bacterium]